MYLLRSDPKKRYHLFQKATQIETVINKLNNCGETYTMAKTRLAIMSKQLEIQAKELNDVIEKYKQLKSVESLKDNVAILNQELVWSYVREQNKIISDLQKNISEQEKKISELNEKIESRSESLQKLRDKQQYVLSYDFSYYFTYFLTFFFKKGI